MYFLLLFVFALSAQSTWKAPEEMKKLANPYPVNEGFIAKGARLYRSMCTACHGMEGRGDGVAAAGLDPKPADFTSERFQSQSPGEIFWKITHGRGVMASYENMLHEEERWALVAYLQSLRTGKAEEVPEAKQEDKPDFPFDQLHNTQTTTTLPAGFSEFTIQHRFGAISPGRTLFDNFLGMDLAANMRIAYAYGITERLTAELGRAKFGKYYNGSLKYALWKTGDEHPHPFRVSFYTDIALMSDRFPSVEEGATFADGEPFQYSWLHRLVYTNEVILSRSLTEEIAVGFSLTGVWRNLVPEGEKNFLLATPVQFRWRVTPKGALTAEIFPEWLGDKQRPEWTVGYEIASSGAHVFQLLLSSTDGIAERRVMSSAGYDYTRGFMVLGFNIKRIF